jgi:hypothetical protein
VKTKFRTTKPSNTVTLITMDWDTMGFRYNGQNLDVYDLEFLDMLRGSA